MTLDVALAGFGYWGPNLARNIAGLPGVRLARICEPDAARRERAARLHPAAALDASFEATLGAPGIDAVLIATPPATHHSLAAAALGSGRHVLVEKPIADSSAQARDLVARAAAAGRVLMVDHTFVYSPAVEHLRAMVRRGALGRLQHYDAVRANLGPFHAGTDVVRDLAVHDLSILDRLTGRLPERVAATEAARGPDGVARIAHLLVRYPDGLLAHLHLSWLSPVKIRRVSLAGERALVVYDEGRPDAPLSVHEGGSACGDSVGGDDADGSARQRRTGLRLGDAISPRLPVDEPLRRVCAAFVASIRDGAPVPTDGAAGLRTLAVVEAAERSIATGGVPCAVEDPHDLPAGALTTHGPGAA